MERVRIVRAREWARPERPARREVLSAVPQLEEGRPPLLFVPGFGHGAWAFAEHWLEHAASRGFPAYALSLRGHGGSEPAPGATLRSYAHDVTQVAAGLPRRAVLVGHGAGARVVTHALAGPPRAASGHRPNGCRRRVRSQGLLEQAGLDGRSGGGSRGSVGLDGSAVALDRRQRDGDRVGCGQLGGEPVDERPHMGVSRRPLRGGEAGGDCFGAGGPGSGHATNDLVDAGGRSEPTGGVVAKPKAGLGFGEDRAAQVLQAEAVGLCKEPGLTLGDI
ncbi:alpha/beta hydrolase [Micromonospora sp. ATA51]|uniref:alpha/beta hydrolase n=1 Tax=Micromonospora sp. ATA51 TaxID=2806098 RepID=UPI0035CB4605